ncbi:DUF2185 domain-containing protein [Listeria sp. FSL L7-1582]|uniref:DUF2185 domain-containing protein n=1 Tax=Listeria portnoyi TaxID=2713504 RepID=UPI00164E8E6C|nr:DUF2185 domain-containing protein [Listeria portnoyi]MBC6310992.1 DUF2185 domain-containing protein [Listeria portnoyi]
MFRKKPPEFIKNAGACIVSKNIVDKKGYLKWALREESVNASDNGWRFFSEIDNDEYLSKKENLVICDFNTVAEIEPAIIAIYLFPFGSDLQLISENGKKYFLDNLTNKKVEL